VRGGFGFLVFLLLTVSSSAEEESPIFVKAEVDKAVLTVGDRVEYRVSISHDPGIQILSQIAPPSSDIFEIKEAHDFSEKQGKRMIIGRRFMMTTYELGEFILEPVVIRYRTAQAEEKSIETNRLYLTVQSVDSSGAPKTDIRNVKGVMELKGGGGWLGVLFLLLIGGGGAFWWWRRRGHPREDAGAVPTVLSLEDEALAQLNRLFDSDLLRRGKVKEYFLALSEILRRYFEGRYEISAIESTTSEVLRDLKQKEIQKELREKIQEALDTADLVKFAKWKPAAPEILKVHQLAKTIIEEARPKVGV